MDAIARLGSLLGLSFIAGINLYATIAVVGLSIKNGLVTGLPPELNVFAHDGVIFVALILYLLEFFMDKIPGLDTLWDALHTIIRPLGGAMLALMQIGHASPVFQVMAFMIGAALAGLSHFTKAGTRLLVQASPEPFSNAALSLGEDVVVFAYAYMSIAHPQWALLVTVLSLVLFAALFPLIFRTLRMFLGSLVSRIVSFIGLGSNPGTDGLPLPDHVEEYVYDQMTDGEHIVWSGPVFATKVSSIPRGTRVFLILTNRRILCCYRKRFQWNKKVMYAEDIVRVRFHPGRVLSRWYVRSRQNQTWVFLMTKALGSTFPRLWPGASPRSETLKRPNMIEYRP